MTIIEHSRDLPIKQKEIVQILAKNPTRRTHDELVDIAHMIKGIQFFIDREMNLESCINVAENLHYEYIEKGGQVFCLGDSGDKFYLIIEGEVSILIYNKAYSHKLRETRALANTIKKLNSTKEAILNKINALVFNISDAPESLVK